MRSDVPMYGIHPYISRGEGWRERTSGNVWSMEIVYCRKLTEVVGVWVGLLCIG